MQVLVEVSPGKWESRAARGSKDHDVSVAIAPGDVKADNNILFKGDPIAAADINSRKITINPGARKIRFKIEPANTVLRYVVNPENPTTAYNQLQDVVVSNLTSKSVSYRTITDEALREFTKDVNEIYIQTESGVLTSLLLEMN